jgi:hypothetical protein
MGCVYQTSFGAGILFRKKYSTIEDSDANFDANSGIKAV